MIQEVLKTDYVIVTYNSELKMIKVEWTGNSTSDEYRDVITKSLDFAQIHPVENYLTDIRNQKVVAPEDRKWFETVAMPKAIDLGLKRAAAIFDGNVFKKYYLNAILKTTNIMKLPFKLVSSEEEAIDFLTKT